MRITLEPKSNRYSRLSGFTIVELIIVIVVIAVLAAIVTVAYNGVRTNAAVSAVKSSLQSALTQIEIDKANNGVYPASDTAVNNGYGLRPGNNVSFSYNYYSSDGSFCLGATYTNLSIGNYYVSSTSGGVKSGTCTPASFTVETYAGSGTAGSSNGTSLLTAQFDNPTSLTFDGTGNLYIADFDTHRIRRITTANAVSTFVGTTQGWANGTGTAARFYNPGGLAANTTTNVVYVGDSNNNRIRSFTSAGVVSTLSGTGTHSLTDGTSAVATFSTVYAVDLDSTGTYLYVADPWSNHAIRRVATSNGTVITFAGSTTGVGGAVDGTGTAARFYEPTGIAVDRVNNIIYVADAGNCTIRKITLAQVVTTLAGDANTCDGSAPSTDGTGSAARFRYPMGLTVDSSGNIYVADSDANKIRKVTPAGVVTTIAGTGTVGALDGDGTTTAQFSWPTDVEIGPDGALYIADSGNNKIRRIAL